MSNSLKTLLAGLVVLSSAAYVGAHCEVPCGIYDDGRRFAEMHEDNDTIAKAIASIEEIASALEAGPQPLQINQASRWVATKEAHATNIQHIISQYFMTQRIKPEDPKYVEKLTAAHKVMVAAMKCKQTSDKATTEALHSAIDAFQKAYGG